jgi:hypothetical protein
MERGSRIEEFQNCIIRPPRSKHSPKDDFSELEFEYEGKVIEGESICFQVLNPAKQKLVCSIVYPKGMNFKENDGAAIVYAHGNASNFSEIGLLVYFLNNLSPKICFVGFDFSGCGNSEGEYVTLGFKERCVCIYYRIFIF